MEKKLKEDIIKAADSVRKKFRELKRGLIAEEENVKRRYQPLLRPLETIIDLTKEKDDIDEEVQNDENKPLKKSLFPSTLNRKRKHPLLKSIKVKNTQAEEDTEVQTQKTPIRDPKLVTSWNEDIYESPTEASTSYENFQKYIQQFGPITRAYMWESMVGNQNHFDRNFGVNFDESTKSWKIGNTIIHFDDEDFIHLGENQVFMGTPGLFELLFKRFPNTKQITDTDKKKYAMILKISSAHRQAHRSDSPLKSGRSNKYKNIISRLPILFEDSTPDSELAGSGLLPVSDNQIDYVYWDNPNELVRRLFILRGSDEAGNKAHRGEIASIEEELREAMIIK